MLKKLPLLCYVLFLLSTLLVLPDPAHAINVTFFINGFEVKVDQQNFGARVLLPGHPGRSRIGGAVAIDRKDLVIDRQARMVGTRIYDRIGPAIRNRIFSGSGKTSINGVAFRVNFTKIALKLQDQKLVATAGKVTGVVGNNISYQKKRFTIKIDPSSVLVTPSKATASVNLKIKSANFSALPVSYINLLSNQCAVASNGAIYGDNFHGSSSFKLKEASKYSLVIRMQDSQFVMIGNLSTTGSAYPRGGLGRMSEGVRLQGYASREGTTAYRFTGKLGKVATDSFVLTLQRDLWAYPEIDYKLHLKSGRVTLSYTAAGLDTLAGHYVADIEVPPNVKDVNNGVVKINDATLKTDKTDALFNNVSVKQQLLAGTPFIIEPDTNEGAWAFFPKWPLQPNQHSSYESIEKPGHGCDKIQAFIDGFANASTIPGVTIESGILHFTSPQIKTDDANNQHQVKTRFASELTLTQWGIVGRLQGRGFSFVPEISDIEKSETSLVKDRTTWEQILSAGNTRPTEPDQRFTLSDLRILDMQVKNLEFCRNLMVEGKAEFRQFVHFPFPSFIDLEFEDLSLNRQGMFARAKGPVASQSIIFPEGFDPNYASQESLDRFPEIPIKGTEMKPNPDTHILWAWRLPISFADRGVSIDHLASNATKIAVGMIPTSTTGGPINSSELWMKPLYSSNSLIQSGLRFKAGMSSKTGGFTLTGWDTNPFFASMYTQPGNEKQVGFLVELKDISASGIVLADQNSDPTSRKQDFAWEGDIQFPFFTTDDKSTWKAVDVMIKDLIPELADPLSMTSINNKFDLDNSLVSTLADPKLEVTVNSLNYHARTSDFRSHDIDAFDIDSGGNKNDLNATYLMMSSYTNGTVYTNSPGPNPQPEDVGGGDTNDVTECGRDKKVRRVMADWQPSSALRDIVCYDDLAVEERGVEHSCSDSYLIGTYEVRTRDCSTLGSCPEDAVVSIPSTKYYTSTKKLLINNSNLVADTDEMADSHPIVINIPSAQVAFSPDGRFIEGAFGATLSTVAASLPYEGELRFKLDTTCGYYYFQGAGSFTYYVRFSGQTFIIHAPYKFLTEPSVFIGVSDILEDLRIRALCDDVDEFTDNAGLSGVQPTTVITGLFTSGNASKDANIGIAYAEVASGPGLYLYQFKNGTNVKYAIGTFLKSRATAGIGVAGIGISITGKGTLLAQATIPSTIDSLRAVFSDGEYRLGGEISLKGCAGILIGHCEAIVTLGSEYSTSEGLDIVDVGLDAGCGGGGC